MERTEYIYLNEDNKIAATLSITENPVNKRQNNWNVAMAIKHGFFPDSTIYLKVFNQ